MTSASASEVRERASSIGVFTRNFSFLGPAGEIPQNLLTLAAMWYMCYWLYRRRIFFKI